MAAAPNRPTLPTPAATANMSFCRIVFTSFASL
jgi:hypothetical protein